MRKCKTCYDTGYITTFDTRFDKDSIERCDNCNRYASDDLAQKSEIREKERTITYDQWERLYRPISDGDWYKDFHPYEILALADKAIVDMAIAEKRLWTEIAENDYWAILPGLARVNRVAYYITEKPCNLNLVVEDKMNVLELKVSLADAKELLMTLDQENYPIDEILPEKSCYLDMITVDDYRIPIETMCKKYHHKIPDALELTW